MTDAGAERQRQLQRPQCRALEATGLEEPADREETLPASAPTGSHRTRRRRIAGKRRCPARESRRTRFQSGRLETPFPKGLARQTCQEPTSGQHINQGPRHSKPPVQLVYLGTPAGLSPQLGMRLMNLQEQLPLLGCSRSPGPDSHSHSCKE